MSMTSEAEIPKPTVKSSRRRRPRKQGDEENRIPNLEEEDWTNDGEGKSNDLQQACQALSKRIRSSEERIKRDVWKSNDALRSAVVRASLRLGSLNGDDDSSDSLLLLHEHESSLIKNCRLIVKEATESKDEKQQFARLFLATHIMRALARLVTKSSTQEALLQLSYHSIQTLGTSESSNDNAEEVMLLSLEAMYHIFLRFKKHDGQARVGFGTVASDQVFLFPIPSKVTGKGIQDDTGLAIDKVCALTVQVLVLVGKKLLYRRASDLPEFLCRLDQRPQTIARHLLTKCAIEWIHFQVRITKNLKEGLTQCKRVYMILWDRATDAELAATEALLLRHDAISVLLADESAVLRKALESKFAETACMCACRASTSFVLSSKTTGSSTSESLMSFHQTVGARLDRIYENKLGLSYLEYSSQRAQHVGLYEPVLRSASDPGQKQFAAVLKVALLSVAVIRQINGEEDDRLDGLIADTEDSIARFRDVFLDSSLHWCWSPEDLSRINKLMAVHLLHKCLYDATKDSLGARSDRSAVRIGARIMVQCVGVFLCRAAKSINSERTMLCEKAIECFLRGCAVLLESGQYQDIASDTVEAAAQEAISFGKEYRLITTETSSHFERFAKVRVDSVVHLHVCLEKHKTNDSNSFCQVRQGNETMVKTRCWVCHFILQVYVCLPKSPRRYSLLVLL